MFINYIMTIYNKPTCNEY